MARGVCSTALSVQKSMMSSLYDIWSDALNFIMEYAQKGITNYTHNEETERKREGERWEQPHLMINVSRVRGKVKDGVDEDGQHGAGQGRNFRGRRWRWLHFLELLAHTMDIGQWAMGNVIAWLTVNNLSIIEVAFSRPGRARPWLGSARARGPHLALVKGFFYGLVRARSSRPTMMMMMTTMMIAIPGYPCSSSAAALPSLS